MHKTWRLIKTMLKMQYSTAGKDGMQLVGYVALGLFLIPMSFILLSFLKNIVFNMYDILSPTGNASIILGLTFLTISAVLFFVSIASILSSFYFSEDIESFIPYPFQPYQLMLGKSANPFIHLYLTGGALFLPIWIFYGIASHAAILYYLYGIILFLLTPIVPFVIAAVILMFFMRFANISKNKDRTKVLAGLLSLMFIIGINIVIRLNQNPENLADNLTVMVKQQDGLLQMVTKFIPTAYISTMALSSSGSFTGFLFMLAMLGISVLAVLVFLSVGQKLYFKGVLGLSSGNKSTFRGNKIQKKMKMRPFWVTYLFKELRILFRTPTFFIQCVVQSLFFPVFLIVILLFENSAFSVGNMLESFNGKYVMLVLFLFTIFSLGLNAASISAVSKDGTNWNINLSYPIKIRHILYSKVGAAWCINLLSITLIFLVGLLFFRLPLPVLFLWLVLALECSWFTSLMGTYLDFLNPKLHWTDEQEVFKSRLIGIKAIVFEAGIFGLITFILWRIPIIGSIWSTSISLYVLVGIATLMVHYLLHKKIASNHAQMI